LKLAPLLAQYLYTNKRLDLPGIGTFLLDPSVAIESDSGKHQKQTVEGISFEINPALHESPDLVGYISAQTGKMKALAAADLSSHLELIQQFLNIGKPFLLEGIGSLVKIKSGKYEFTSGGIHAEKLKDLTVKEATLTSAKEESFSSYDAPKGADKASIGWQKPVIALLILIGAGLAVWGGYTIYKNKSSGETQVEQSQSVPTTPVEDSSTLAKRDSNPPPVASSPAGGYKFVLEKANIKRATARLKLLKTYNWNVQMETKDSLQYKLFLVIPGTASDTTRILDSLTALNGRRVHIEN
jgi:hypothetical protein